MGNGLESNLSYFAKELTVAVYFGNNALDNIGFCIKLFGS